jgi:hypothetical protein
MVRRFIDSGTDGAEWSAGHLALGFRICCYNHEHKEGPVHVHDRYDDVIGPLPAMTKARAMEIVRAFVDRHDWFDYDALNALAEEMLHADPN